MKIESNYKKVKNILLVLLVANLVVAVSKIAVGIAINSSSVMADGFHSLSDSASNIVGLIGIALASKPKDDCHPYGHKKFETIASVFIGTMLLFISFNIINTSIKNLFKPSTLEVSIESLIIVLVTLFINIIVAIYENKQGHKLKSNLLIADSLHTKSDIFVSIGVIITLVSVRLGIPPIIDTFISFVIALFILHSSYEIFKENLSFLTDRVILDEKEVINILKEFNNIENVHNIRSRGDKDCIFLDMHIKVDSKLRVDEAHKLVHDVEEALVNRLGEKMDVIIHVEPNKRLV